MKKKILIVFGTRPEAIKMAPLVKMFLSHSDEIETRVCVTAQHRQMLDQVLDFFGIKPDYDLDLMKEQQTLNSITAKILMELKPILDEYKPDYVFVHGDTTTSTASALAAYYSFCKVAHVEAGLRTWDKQAPYPEELNRQLTARIADIHFAPTIQARDNLLKEGIRNENVIITGNTVIDALFESLTLLKEHSLEEIDNLKRMLSVDKEIILVTGHRRENFGQGFVNICEALKRLALNNSSVEIIYPVHLNPSVQQPVKDILSGIKNIKLISPLSYPAFVWLMEKSKLIITDSGGVQEEAPSLGKPVLVMRNVTERPEAVNAGTVVLVGTDVEKIVFEAQRLLDNEQLYKQMTSIRNPYGDGNASRKIVEFILNDKR